MFIDAKSDISMALFRLQHKLVFLYSKTFYIETFGSFF